METMNRVELAIFLLGLRLNGEPDVVELQQQQCGLSVVKEHGWLRLRFLLVLVLPMGDNFSFSA